MVHAHYHTLAYSLFFLFNSFFFSKFFVLSFTHFLASFSLCSILLLSLVSLFFIMHDWGPFYIACHDGFLLFYPLIAFVLVWVSFLDHPLVCQLPNHHHLLMLVVLHPIPKQRVLFCLLAHRGILIRIRVNILSHYPSWHAPSDFNSSFYLLGGMLSQQDISPKRVWVGTLE